MNEFITGNAGTGKSYLVRERCAQPGYGILTASTGIAGVNLGATTINSLFKFFNFKDLERKFNNYKLEDQVDRLWDSGVLGTHVVLDEVSMFEAKSLDLLYRVIQKVGRGKLHLVLTGDFAQLPPVEGEFAFKADCWPEFEKNTTKLTRIWRQDDLPFLMALEATRRAEPGAADALEKSGVGFTAWLNPDFQGVTLMATNDEADGVNKLRYTLLDGKERIFTTVRNGEQVSEWEKLIPNEVRLKVGARVMITANQPDTMAYANGDTGVIVKFHKKQDIVEVLLDRTGEAVWVANVYRRNFDYATRPAQEVGSIVYMPIKLAYALTIHKSQGLTLPKVQVVVRHHWAGNPASMYVALSRVKRAADVTIIGPKSDLVKRIKTHPEVLRWL